MNFLQNQVINEMPVWFLDLLGLLLNQVRTGHRPARDWFPNIDPVRTSVCVCVCVFVCVSVPEAINN